MREGLIQRGGAAVDIDGSRGEGGGQILRTSLALSMITGRPLRMRQVRAGRAKPGLRRQHLACVHAAQRLCHAEVRGDEVGSMALDFTPRADYDGWAEALVIDIGSAGSTTLVVQTILVPAIISGRALRVTVHGGTHNPMAPPFEFLERVFLPHLHAMGAAAALGLERHGFATGRASRARAGEDDSQYRGELSVTVQPGTLRPIEIVEAGELTARRATAILARLPTHVADRELGVV
nr:hypothetical protein [Myxococcota bacterium]